MKFNSDIHHRRTIRLKEYDYSAYGYYFVTICTQNRECLFGKIINGRNQLFKVGEIVKKYWHEIPGHFNGISIDVFVVMPNHFHGIVIIEDGRDMPCRGLINQTPTTTWILQKNPKMVLGKIIRYFKAKTTFTIHVNGFTHFQWQRNYYEHIIRNEYELNRIREYIILNPLQWQFDRNNPKL